MDRKDIYYRAIRKYREITNSFDSCKNDRDELSLNNNDKDFLIQLNIYAILRKIGF